ncbi:MAG: metalloprotease TldD, partial [Gammaproteobacteria bacterium]|nr:metalloprotease TldD [Gammaproteobacteria bacterium]
MTTETFHNRNLDRAREALLAPAGIGAGEIDQVMGRMLGHQIDYADLYFQYSRQESWSLEEGQVKSGNRHIEQGVGVRAIAGE